MELLYVAAFFYIVQDIRTEDLVTTENHIEYFNSPKSALLSTKSSLFLPFLHNYNLVSLSEPSGNKYYPSYLPYSQPAYSDCVCGLASSSTQRSPRSAEYDESTEFSIQSDDSRIVGGVEALPHSLPWMVLIMSQQRNAPFCGGSIISDRYILTAAHCYDGKIPIEDIKVVVGEHDRCRQDRITTTFSVDKIIIHPNFRHADFFADIMLLRLSMKITFNRFVRPICLPQQGSAFDNNWAIVSGWGTENSSGTLQCPLMQATIPVLSQQECASKSKYPPNAIHATLFCAGVLGQGGKDSCQGDSGGPLQLVHPRSRRFTLIGVVSNGIGCGLPEYPGLYTSVSKFINWIASISQDSSYCIR